MGALQHLAVLTKHRLTVCPQLGHVAGLNLAKHLGDDVLHAMAHHGSRQDVQLIAQGVCHLDHVSVHCRFEVLVVFFGHQSMPKLGFLAGEGGMRHIGVGNAEGGVELGHIGEDFFQQHEGQNPPNLLPLPSQTQKGFPRAIHTILRASFFVTDMVKYLRALWTHSTPQTPRLQPLRLQRQARRPRAHRTSKR